MDSNFRSPVSGDGSRRCAGKTPTDASFFYSIKKEGTPHLSEDRAIDDFKKIDAREDQGT
jgi:hypothetical protein